jgi:hypothetical protein
MAERHPRQTELFPGIGDGNEPLFAPAEMDLLAEIADQASEADEAAGRDLTRWAKRD